jgi:hypothetical protein
MVEKHGAFNGRMLYREVQKKGTIYFLSFRKIKENLLLAGAGYHVFCPYSW